MTTQNQKTRLSFCGGAQSVTGSNFLIEDGDTKILVDCGLFQGCAECDAKNRKPFPYNPQDIDVVLITHAHIDHIGRLPKLVKEGFRGTIYSTFPARDLAEVMLKDSLKVFGLGTGERELPPLYGREDVEKTMELWEAVPYGEPIHIKTFRATLRNSGHVLGSALVEISRNNKKIVFTGDLGGEDPILKKCEVVRGADYIVMESVYGDRLHEHGEERKNKLEDVIEDTIARKGVLMIPAFSLERTQQLLFDLNDLVENSKIPIISIFLDSPLAIKITEVYKKYTRFFNENAQRIIRSGDDIFKFTNLHPTLTPEESIAIRRAVNPKVIIAGSGMSTGGRIVYHEKRYLPDPNNTLLIIGYQAAGTPGREIQEGAKVVTIDGEKVPVRARVETITGYSAHMDADELLEFVAEASQESSLRKVFVVMGELSSSTHLSQRIRDYLDVDTMVPDDGEVVEIDL